MLPRSLGLAMYGIVRLSRSFAVLVEMTGGEGKGYDKQDTSNDNQHIVAVQETVSERRLTSWLRRTQGRPLMV